jgi:hypothetical protein
LVGANGRNTRGRKLKKVKKKTQKGKGKAPKENCWREMTKHEMGKEKWEKKKINKEKANCSLFADKKRRNQLFRLKTIFVRRKTKNLSMLKGISINATPRTIRRSSLVTSLLACTDGCNHG